MTVLRWDAPARVMSRTARDAITADGAPPGVYVSNMSRADELTWRAKYIGGADPRVEVRTLKGAQIVVVIRLLTVSISANGRMDFHGEEFEQLARAVAEARDEIARRARV